MRKTNPKDVYIAHVKRDALILLTSVVLAVFLARSGLIAGVVQAASGYGALASLLAGMFFTSIFTVAPATVALVNISSDFAPLHVAIWGGLGAMIMDCLIFLFVRDRLYVDVNGLMQKSLRNHLLSLFHYGFVRWVVLFAGAFFIASPLPDEVGMTLISLTRVKITYILPVVLILHMFGIFVFVSAANMFL